MLRIVLQNIRSCLLLQTTVPSVIFYIITCSVASKTQEEALSGHVLVNFAIFSES